ncbi:MAG: oligosaccharide flippase family protein [Polyangiaceae bacterium]|nr:oligosaccharide flippase family protein [Polyangiaceae bacterium]
MNSSTEKSILQRSLNGLAGQGLWTAAGTVTSSAIGLAQVVIVTRLLGVETFGQIALIMAVTLTVRQVVGVRVWEWAMREFSGAYVRRDAAAGGTVIRTGFALSIGVNLVSFLIVLGVSRFSAQNFLHAENLTVWIAIYGMSLLVSWIPDTAYGVMRVSERFRFLAVQSVVLSLLRFSILSGAAWFRPTVGSAVVAYLAVESLSAAWMLASTGRIFRKDFGISWWQASRSRRLLFDRSMRKLLLIGSLTDLLKIAGGRADLLVLGWFSPPSDVGLYRAAWNLVEIFDRLSSPLSMIVFSRLAKLATLKARSEYLALLRNISLGAAALVIPGCLSLFFLAPWLVATLYGPSYAPATRIVQTVAWCPLWLVGIWMQPNSVSVGRAEWGLKLVTGVTIWKLALLAAFVPTLGAQGLASANLLYNLAIPLFLPWMYVQTKKLTKLWVAIPTE